MDRSEIERMARIEERHWWFRERRALLLRYTRDLPRGRVVDVGAAAGAQTAVLADEGWTATAVEWSPEGATLAAERGVTVVRGDAMRLPLRDGSQDLAVAFDVLEHLEDDLAAARELLRVLRPGGLALVAVPADPQLWSAHDQAVGHFRRYTREALQGLLAGAGFDPVTLWSWNVLLRPAAAWRRRRATDSDIQEVARPLNAALSAVVRLERHLPVGRLPGVSLMARAYRPDGQAPA